MIRNYKTKCRSLKSEQTFIKKFNSVLGYCFFSLLILFATSFTHTANAQMSTKYYYQGYTSFPYTPLSTGTTLASGTAVGLDSLFTNVEIGFNFNFNCNTYTQVGISSNGFIWFGSTNPSSNEYNPISSTAGYDGAISAYGTNLKDGHSSMNLAGAAPTSSIKYVTTGTAPYRVFTAEWRKVSAVANLNNSTDMQIRLYESSGKVEIIVWDWPYLIQGATTYGQLGIRGATNTDFANRKVIGANNWCNSLAGTANTDNCAIVCSYTCNYPSTGDGFDLSSANHSAICYTYVPIACDGNWNIQGQVYHDTDNDCGTVAGEPSLNGIKVKLYDAVGSLVQQTYTFSNGNYYFNTGLGDFYVSVDTNSNPYSVLCPTGNTQFVSLTVPDSLASGVDFRLVCKSGYDVGIRSVYYNNGRFRPGKTVSVNISAGDLAKINGFTCNAVGLTGKVRAIKSGPVKFVGTQPSGGIVSGDTISWTVANFSTAGTVYKMNLQVDSTALALQTVCFNVAVTADAGTDVKLTNNTTNRCYTISNSFDPNDKAVYPQEVHEQGQWLTYDVNFQNVGNDYAEEITILDTMDARLDVSTFEMLAVTHANVTQMLKGGVLKVRFPNINLPDSTTNKTASKGFIQYKIKMKDNVPSPAAIHNTAAIYFDLNPAVKTNDAEVHFCMASSAQKSLQVCQGDSVQIGNAYYKELGSYPVLYNGIYGCDSTVITNLTVKLPSSSSFSTQICSDGSYQLPDGRIVSEAGPYTSKLAGINTCDSIVTTTISIKEIDHTISQNNNVLTANVIADSYQWYDFDNGTLIPGATSKSYTATSNGTYSVQITSGNCTEMSLQATVTAVGVENVETLGLSIYPNPAKQSIVISHSTNMNDASIAITDLSGRVIMKQVLNSNSNTTISLENISSGSYYVQLISEGKNVAVKKFVVIK